MARFLRWMTVKSLTWHPRLTSGSGSLCSAHFGMTTRRILTSPHFLSGASFSTLARLHSAPLVWSPAGAKCQSTLKIDDKLPHLPVPALNDTLVKYVRSIQPLLTEAEFQNTKNVVKAFADENGIGPKLQIGLEQRAKAIDNWLSDWWLGSAYLEYRAPVPIFSSPGLVFPIEKFSSTTDQLRYAAKLIYGALQYKNLIDTKTIPEDRMGNSPLDMSQYNKVFGTNRTPGKTRDVLKYSPNSRHFVIAYKNYFYKVPAYANDNKILEPAELLRQIKYVIESTSGLSGIPFGLLTSETRDNWARIHETFRKDKVNEASLQVLEEALFLVCIDRPNRPLKSPKGTTSAAAGVEDLSMSERQTVSALQMIHGNRTNSGNRWFDKTIQFIVGCEGECGLTYEHSPAEGPPIANLMDYILENQPVSEALLKDSTDGTPTYTPEKLQFNIDQKVSDAIAEANQSLGKLVDDLDMGCFTFKKYGKNQVKTWKFSPDSFIQMAIQSAFHRVHKIPGAHYESASTRIFVGGRTETIRSCSVESLDFSKALNTAGVSSQEKYEAMQKAIEGHKNYAAQAIRGHGVDRHLLGLKLIAKERGIPMPELFTDVGFVKSTHFRLSTSQVASRNQTFMCYSPLVSDGYGCCYNPRSQDISFGISAFNSCPDTSAERFKIALQEVLLDMQEVASQNSRVKS